MCYNTTGEGVVTLTISLPAADTITISRESAEYFSLKDAKLQVNITLHKPNVN